ncbi:MAG: hypothetical protein DRP85_04170 [Candidatus Makaraimicrobium thalassicum]|nr:MAG: hypothetical protein DRP85_04170 [Candidatus Omnitrophota bacterium]
MVNDYDIQAATAVLTVLRNQIAAGIGEAAQAMLGKDTRRVKPTLKRRQHGFPHNIKYPAPDAGFIASKAKLTDQVLQKVDPKTGVATPKPISEVPARALAILWPPRRKMMYRKGTPYEKAIAYHDGLWAWYLLHPDASEDEIKRQYEAGKYRFTKEDLSNLRKIVEHLFTVTE